MLHIIVYIGSIIIHAHVRVYNTVIHAFIIHHSTTYNNALYAQIKFLLSEKSAKKIISTKIKSCKNFHNNYFFQQKCPAIQ